MLAALPLVLAIDPPTVEVDIDALTLPQAQAEQLHGELMTRLVESGHAVGTSGAIVVRLTGGGEHVHVEVQHGTRAATRDVRGKGALLRLATIHAALELLAEQDAVVDPDPVRAAARDRSVVVVAEPGAQAWLPAVIEALVDAGQVVTPHAASASTRVCLDVQDERPTLAAVGIDEPCPDGTPSSDLGGDAVALVSAARARAPVSTRDPKEEDPSTEEAAPTIVPAPVVRTTAKPSTGARAPAWTGVLGIGLGGEGRLSAAEPLVLVHGDARHLGAQGPGTDVDDPQAQELRQPGQLLVRPDEARRHLGIETLRQRLRHRR